MGGDALGLSVGAEDGVNGFTIRFVMGGNELGLPVIENERDTGLFVGFGIRDGMGLLSLSERLGAILVESIILPRGNTTLPLAEDLDALVCF